MPFAGYKIKGERNRFDPGGKTYTMSRSKLDRFLECPRCFWMEARYGIGRPDTPPFTLNNAVDELMKREFDICRAAGEVHPLAKKYDIDAVPFVHEKLEEWRDALRNGIKYHDPETNIILRGGIDDVWQNTKGELHIVDYKATAGKKEITLDDDWKIAYKRQIEIYQWLFKMNGFTVSPTAYFVYVNGKNDKDSFDGKLEFDLMILPYEGDTSWVPVALQGAKECLMMESIPETGESCEYCPYREAAGKTLQLVQKNAKAKK